MTARGVSSPAALAALWAGVLAGPVAWAADLLVSYAFVRWTCGHHTHWPLHAVSAAALLVIAMGAGTSWWALRGLPDEEVIAARDPANLDIRVAGRVRFMAELGLASCALFAFVVIATAIPLWVFDACR